LIDPKISPEEFWYNRWTILWLKSMVAARETTGALSEIHQSHAARRNARRLCYGALHSTKEKQNGRTTNFSRE
jgi:hypothetical protein